MADYLEKIAEAEARARALEEQLADPLLAQKPSEYQRLGKQLALQRPLVEAGRRYRALLAELEGAREMLQDDDLEIAEMARSDIARLAEERDALEQELRQLLVPPDPNDDRNAILEIRAGTGGDEAALFAADLFRMYTGTPSRRAGRSRPCPSRRPPEAASRRSSRSSPATACSGASSTSVACTACSGCPPPNPRVASTPRR